MAEVPLPNHVVIQRRDGRKEVLLHRSMAVMSDEKVEIRSARGTIFLPLFGLLIASGLITWIAMSQSMPFWALVFLLLVCIFLVPVSVMALVSAIGGADVVGEGRKGAATWQQGYLGMGIGTKELVPFAKIDYLEISIEGETPDRWREQPDDLRQFALILVKKSGKRLNLAQVPVPAYGQVDGMDRTLAVAQAVAAVTGAEVRLPAGWELVEVDTETGSPLEAAPATAANTEPAAPIAPAPARHRRRRAQERP